jgi:inorganic pyrophosphatase
MRWARLAFEACLLPDSAADPSMRTAADTLESLPTRDDGGAWLAVIEATQGTRHKFKYHARWRAFVLSGVLPLGLRFPYDFGFLPSTRGEDGDPLDVLVLADEALPPGVVVPCRLLGVIEASQRDKGQRRAKRNDRLIAVAAKSHRYADCVAMRDLATGVLAEIEQFFVAFNAQKGGVFKPLARRGAAVAARLVESGARCFASTR